MASTAKNTTLECDIRALVAGLDGTFDLSELYSGLDDPQIEADMVASERAADEFVAKWSERTDYMEDPKILREALDDAEAYSRFYDDGAKPFYYAILRKAVESGNAEVKQLYTQIRNRMTEMSNKGVFFGLNLGRIAPETQQMMLNAPELVVYRQMLSERFENAQYDLGEDVQKAVNLILPHATEGWKSMLSEQLSKATVTLPGEEARVPFTELGPRMTSKNIDEVTAAQEAHTRILRKYASMAEAEFNNVVAARTKMSELRGHARVESASFLSSGLSAEIVDSMLATVEANYTVVHDIYRLKADLLGVSKLNRAQRSMPYGTLPSGFTFSEAAELVHESFSSLHPSFGDEFAKALRLGRIDWVPRTGKRGGACCWSGSMSMPPYLLLNFKGSLGNVLTLGHESGHYLNDIHMQQGGQCNGLTYNVGTSRAEVASMFQEPFVLDLVMNNVDDETRLAIMVDQLMDSTGSIFHQVAGTRFEQSFYAAVAEKGYLDKRQISELFMQHVRAYMGPSVEQRGNASYGWVHWHHLRLGFYNYSYAFAELVSMAMRERVLADPGYIDEFRRFLRAGSSVDTLSLMDSMNLNVRDGSVWNAGLGALRQQTADARALAVKLGKL